MYLHDAPIMIMSEQSFYTVPSTDIVDIIGHTDTKIISDVHLSKLVRQMAVHANVSDCIKFI